MISHIMSEPIVERLEVIDVDHQDADRARCEVSVPGELGQQAEEAAPVGDPGHAVGGRFGFRLGQASPEPLDLGPRLEQPPFDVLDPPNHRGDVVRTLVGHSDVRSPEVDTPCNASGQQTILIMSAG